MGDGFGRSVGMDDVEVPIHPARLFIHDDGGHDNNTMVSISFSSFSFGSNDSRLMQWIVLSLHNPVISNGFYYILVLFFIRDVKYYSIPQSF